MSVKPLMLNVRHLETQVVQFEGELEWGDLDATDLDELVHPVGPVVYAFGAERHEQGVLLQGRLEWTLNCECVRCLKAFRRTGCLDPWVCLLPWQGEEAIAVRNDCVDLTPYLREDMVLELPQRPLCSENCEGLPEGTSASATKAKDTHMCGPAESPWQALDKLNL